MERSNFFGDQLVTDADLNNIETTTASQLIRRSQGPLGDSGGIGHDTVDWTAAAVVQGGIYGSPADYLDDSKNFYVLYVTNYILKIAAGQAIDTNGNFIKAASYIQPIKGFAATNWVWTATPSATNYVKLRYQETSGSVGANDAGDQFYTRYYDSFFVQIDGIAPTSSDILLCTFLAGGSGEITNSSTLLDRRTYVRTVTTADAVMLDPTTKKVASHTSVYDHVQAVGTGTPSVTNPHGLSLGDMGFVIPTSSIVEHRQSEHVSGILLNQKTAASFQSFSASVVSNPIDYLAFTSPVGASMSVGGNIITFAPSHLAANSVSAEGIYYACATSVPGSATFVTTSVFGGAGLDMAQNLALMNTLESSPHDMFDSLLPIELVYITLSPDYIITPLLDVRCFYGMSPYDIRPDFSESTSTDVLVDSSTHINSLVDNLARMRAQIGIALSGTASVWGPGSPNPLTAGPSSNADAYHTHASMTEVVGALATGSVGAGSYALMSLIGSPGNIKSLANQFSDTYAPVQQTSGSARAENQVYQNTYERTMFVTITGMVYTDQASDYARMRLVMASDPSYFTSIDSPPNNALVTWLGEIGSRRGATGTESDLVEIYGTMSAFIPSGKYYKLDCIQTGDGYFQLQNWVEQQ